MKKRLYNLELKPYYKQQQYTEKAILLHKKCKWQNYHQKNSELFLNVVAYTTKYIPGAQERSSAGTLEIRLGENNFIRIHTVSFTELKTAFDQLNEFLENNAELLDLSIQNEWKKEHDHNAKRYAPQPPPQ